jgi:hypothetical protein
MEHCVVENGQLMSPMQYLSPEGKMKQVEPFTPLVIKSVGKIDELIKVANNELKSGLVSSRGLFISLARRSKKGRERGEYRARETLCE